MKPIAVLSTAILCSMSVHATVVYDNTSNSLNRTYSPGNGIEFGDEIFLAGTDRTITEFQFETFTSSNASGDETAQIIFRLNDGINGAPNTEIARSELFPLGAGNNTTETHVWSGLFVPLSADNFTWSVVFQGIDDGEQVGVGLYGTPFIGSSFDDFWQNDGGTWGTLLIDGGATPANFGAHVMAVVPEPSTIALAGIGSVALLGFLLRRRNLAR